MWMGVITLCLTAIEPSVLSNDLLALRLGEQAGVPVIEGAVWRTDGKAVFSASQACPADAWIPRELIPDGSMTPQPWHPVESSHFQCAETVRSLAEGLEMTWHVALAKQAPLLEMHIHLENRGPEPRAIPWFPVWTAHWAVDGVERVRGWHALSYAREDCIIDKPASITWESHIHSSDTLQKGMNPYWAVKTATGHIYCALAWCGGWQARIEAAPEALGFSVVLPPEETQLTLKPGESIDGPVLSVSVIAETDETLARAAWMAYRAVLAKAVYGGPAPAYPFTYNHWYTTRFAVDAPFLERQVREMTPYGFDAFIVDAGWYAGVGKWTPDTKKFPDASFEHAMRAVKDAGAVPGIWTCPQFVQADKNALPPEVDQPGMYRKFIDGYLLDLYGSGFTQRLLDHVATLRADYHAGWWKYDQDFFTENTRAGRMKNVCALQQALMAVRRANPDLVIENCQSGGRMNNEFTIAFAQSQWLCDGGHTGIQLAHDSIGIALNAMDFVFPWECNRWTNNPDKVDGTDKALFRYWCRAAMAGTWGIVADLGAIDEARRTLLLEARDQYRRLNTFKQDLRYDLMPPHDGQAMAGAVFHRADGTGAAALLFRWECNGPIEQTIPLRWLDIQRRFIVEDVDAGTRVESSGQALRDNGLAVQWPPERTSALLFIEPGA